MVTRLPLALILLATTVPVEADPAPESFKAGLAAQIDKTGQTEDIRFKTERYERMTVPVRLSNTGPYRFLVDTGADRTAISRELATKLNLESGSNAELHSVTGVSTVSTAMVPNLQLTRKSLKIIDAPVLSSSNMGADGILGVDSLRSQRVVFDFAAQTMSIVPSTAADFKDEPGTIVVEAYRRNGRLIITDAVASGHDLTVVLDTGSQVSVGNEALCRQLFRDKSPDGLHQIELESVTGEKLVGDVEFVPNLELGGITLSHLAVVFADAHTFKQLKLDGRPALLLGMNAIRAFKKVSIDFANRKLRVVMPGHSELDVQFVQTVSQAPPKAL
jgi:predicted aspartyl protease